MKVWLVRKERLCLGSKIYTKIQLSIFLACFSDTEWGRRDSKVQLLSFPLNIFKSLLWPGTMSEVDDAHLVSTEFHGAVSRRSCWESR